MFFPPSFIQASLLVFTSATAVPVFGSRFSDLAAVLFVVSLVFLRPRGDLSGDGKISIFLLFIVFALIVSTAHVSLVDAQKVEFAISNAVTVPLGVVLSLACLWFMSSDRVLEVASIYSSMIVLLCSVLLIFQVTHGVPDWIVYDEEFDRFSALSQNPNQLALYLLPVPFFSIVAYSRCLKGVLVVVVEVFLVLAINFFMLGKALFIGWGLSLLVLFILGWVWFGPVQLSGFKFFRRLLVSLVSVGLVLPLLLALYKGETVGSQEGQGDIRVQLWRHGLEAWTQSIVVGNGPGHFSGIEAPFQNMEAHNFLIDWLSAYGLLGGLALFFYFSWLLFYAVTKKAWVVLALYLTLLVQVTFHFYGRQPLFWMLLVFGYFIASSSGKSRRGAN